MTYLLGTCVKHSLTKSSSLSRDSDIIKKLSVIIYLISWGDVRQGKETEEETREENGSAKQGEWKGGEGKARQGKEKERREERRGDGKGKKNG